MDANTRRQIKALEKLRLPELQARFAEVTGETSRSPNRTYLIRKITEVLTAQAAAPRPGETVSTAAATMAAPAAADESAAPRAPSAPARPGRRTTGALRASGGTSPGGAGAPRAPRGAAQGASDEPRLSKLSIEALREKYAEVVGRVSDSQHRGYLLWKIRQAQKGRIRVGPARQRSSASPDDFKVLPLRMETATVEHLDAARERLGLASRTELFRRALQLYLKKAGEAEVAALFVAPSEA